MLIIGSHVTFKNDTQLVGSVKEALSYGANTFMFYTGAPQNTYRSKINPLLTKEAEMLMQAKINKSDVIVHAPYIINLASATNRDFAVTFLKQEIERTELLGMTKLVLHPGSALDLDRQVAINNIIQSLNEAIRADQHVIILIETMAGKGSELGVTIEEVATIIHGVTYQDKVGICLDTCHLNDAGYDVSQFDQILDDIDKQIGLAKVGCVHLNDSKNVKGSHKDRHANLGFGTIGFDNLLKIVYNSRLVSVPKILETPYIGNDDKERLYPPYKFEIAMIKAKQFDDHVLDDIRAYYHKKI